MKVETAKYTQTTTSVNNQTQTSTKNTEEGDYINFKDELNNANQVNKEDTDSVNSSSEGDLEQTQEKSMKLEEKPSLGDSNVEGAINGLQGMVDEISKLNRTNENKEKELKLTISYDDEKNKHEELSLIDNNMNIQEPKEKINLQMGGNTDFTGNGQPFAEFVNQTKAKEVLKSSAQDLAEEKAIMSTMEENIAIANKNMVVNKTKIVENSQGIRKVDKNSNITVDTIVKYDTVVMDKADVDFFVKLVKNGEVSLNEIQHTAKSAPVSKALADLLVKSMQDNKPVRIDFDNDISVIIKIGRDGKISADFLPSSQIAEAYLKENLPLLRQRFDDQNLEYGELNQRKQKQDDQENRKKGRKDE